jgi:hypothetical protein
MVIDLTEKETVAARSADSCRCGMQSELDARATRRWQGAGRKNSSESQQLTSTRRLPTRYFCVMPATALPAAREQLNYWLEERDKARLADDAERVARCEHFIKQCGLVIAALERAAQHSSGAAGTAG